MENTGTWNSDLALLVFAALMFPIVMYFLGAILDSMRFKKHTNNYTETDDSNSPPIINITNKYYSRRPREHKPKKKTKKKINNSSPVIDDAVSGLVNMGYKK